MGANHPRKPSSQTISLKGLSGFVVAIVLFCLSIFVGCPFIESMGFRLGTAAGSAVGAAQGSYRGVTEGIASGQQDGIQDGLSADDTQTQIYNRLQEIAKLEVLIVGNSFTNVQTIGKGEYAVMYQLEGEGVWTVDLKTASISVDSDHRTVNVSLAPPEIQSYIDDAKTLKIAEYQKNKNAGTTEEGMEANRNARKAVEEEYQQSLLSDSDLMAKAKESAQMQLTRLIGNICRNSMKVDITFTDER